MNDFASAGMWRLLARGLAARRAAPPLALPAGAQVPLQDKRRLVGSIIESGGLALLLELARGVHHIAGEPMHQALIGAADPHDFFARWQRLERYVHASHRVQRLHAGPLLLHLRHASRHGAGAAPLPAESLAVLGVWIGALEAIGSAQLRVDVAGQALHPLADPGSLQRLAAAGQLGDWTFSWAASSRAQASVAAQAQALPYGSCAAELQLPWGEPAMSLARHLLARPMTAPRLGGAARALGLSARTLQRRLAVQGMAFNDVVGELRVRLACTWLAHSRHELAEIGYLCGYADQPHFTREFTRRAGLPPLRYRQAAVSAPAPGD